MRKKFILKFAVIISLGLAVYLLGYFRNFVFVTINAQSSSVYYHDTAPALPAFLGFIAGKSYLYLIRLKWVFTFLFSIVFCLSSMVVMRIYFKEKVYIKICLVTYIFMFLASLSLMCVGYILPSFSAHAYNISRNIMHITQSPFTILLLFVIALYHSENRPA